MTFLTTLVLMTGIVGFNRIVDPFCMFGGPYKPAVYQRVRLLKAYEVRRVRPDSILLATSRGHLGIRPSHPLWKKRAERPYNLAFDGATTKEMYHYLVHTQSLNQLKVVLLGLDLYHLFDVPATTRPDFDPAILNEGRPVMDRLRQFATAFKILSSWDALRNSFKFLREGKQDQDWFSPNGQRLGEIYFRRPSENFEIVGPRSYFDEIDRLEVQFMLEGNIPMRSVKVYPPGLIQEDPITSFGYIKKIVEFCRAHNIELKVFLSPSHAHQLQLARAIGEWDKMRNDKLKLVSYLSQKNVPLYDFSVYSSVTTERLPPAGSKKEIKYYWDSSHYKENVGDMILDCVLFEASDRPCALGNRVVMDNVDKVLEKIEERRRNYEEKSYEDVKLIEGYVSEFKKRHGL